MAFLSSAIYVPTAIMLRWVALSMINWLEFWTRMGTEGMQGDLYQRLSGSDGKNCLVKGTWYSVQKD